jgi:hypothetical protein
MIMQSTAIVVLLLFVGCGSVKVEGECSFVREIKTTYTCEKDGAIEHIRVAPGGPPEP